MCGSPPPQLLPCAGRMQLFELLKIDLAAHSKVLPPPCSAQVGASWSFRRTVRIDFSRQVQALLIAAASSAQIELVVLLLRERKWTLARLVSASSAHNRCCISKERQCCDACSLMALLFLMPPMDLPFDR